ncbi:hypothetical protein LguiA_031610 [Lonicera macranthoides]
MGGRAATSHLIQLLNEHLNTVHETFQVLDQTPASSLEKVGWNQVIQMGQQVYKQATTGYAYGSFEAIFVCVVLFFGRMCGGPFKDLRSFSLIKDLKIDAFSIPLAYTAGMLWTGETPKVTAVEENMAAYFNVLQGFLLLSHGSKVGAGPTLSSCIHASVKQVIDCSFMLLKDAVSSYESPQMLRFVLWVFWSPFTDRCVALTGTLLQREMLSLQLLLVLGSRIEGQKRTIPQLVGTVWDACDALKKTPTTNITAIGRSMTQVAVSMKDVLREMKELKPASSDLQNEASLEAETENHDSDDSSTEDLGNDLSAEEMKISQLAIVVVSNTLVMIKELIRSITGLLKQENGENGDFVNSLERLLLLCQGIGAQIDEVGACLYPPQEGPAMKAASEKIRSSVEEIQMEVENLKGSSEAFVNACIGLRSSLTEFESGLGCPGDSDSDLIPKMENLVVSS